MSLVTLHAMILLVMNGSIHNVRDEEKDNVFELELSWCCDESGKLFQKVRDQRVGLQGTCFIQKLYCFCVPPFLFRALTVRYCY